MWLVVKKGKKFNEKLIINQNQIKLITEPKLRYTSIEEDRKTIQGRSKYDNDYNDTTYTIFYMLEQICEIELIDGKKIVCKIKGVLENLDNVIESWDFNKTSDPMIYSKTMDNLKNEKMKDVFSEEELERISSILKDPQKEIDRKNKELDEKESEK